MHTKKRITTALAALALGLTASTAFADEEGTVKILAPWQSTGQAFPIAEDTIAFYGVSDGIMYIENAAKATLNAAQFVCPGIRTIDLKKQKTTSEGHCVINPAHSEDVIFAEFSCKGSLDACEGKFTLTGGTGEFKGISGSGKIQVLTAMASVVADIGTGDVIKDSAGLAIWPELKYRIPSHK